jgi:hypothetical protein
MPGELRWSFGTLSTVLGRSNIALVEGAPEEDRRISLSRIGIDEFVTALAAVLVFVLAVNRGTYGVESRAVTGIVILWTIVISAGLGLVRVRRPTAAAAVVSVSLLAFGLLTLLSWIWSPNPAAALDEFNQVASFVGVFVLIATIGRVASVRAWSDGIAIGIAAVGLFSVVTRLIPELVNTGAPLRDLPGGQARLAYPIGYWNALAILIAIGMPLLLRVAVDARGAVSRALAAGVLPALGGALYLTSSRTGALSAVIGTLLFALAYRRRRYAIVVIGLCGTGVAVCAWIITGRGALMNGPLESHAAAAQGHAALPMIAAVCVVVGLVWGFGSRYAASWGSVRVDRGVAIGVVVVAVIAVFALHPLRQFDRFKSTTVVATTSSDYATRHLLSASGNGRWQLWTVALKEWRAHPVLGGGTGSFLPAWTQKRPYNLYVQNAHSLVAETVAELGAAGLLLLLGFFGGTVVVGVRRIAAATRDTSGLPVALVGAFLAFAAGASVDWIWQVPAVAIVGVAVAALVCSLRPRPGVEESRELPVVARVSAVVVGVVMIATQALPLISDIYLNSSQTEAARGNLAAAARDARAARSVTPWAAAPYVQLAQIQESTGANVAALSSIAAATARETRNYYYWYLRAQYAAKVGHGDEATASMVEAVRLNPIWAKTK